jgi:hypothetical protein
VIRGGAGIGKTARLEAAIRSVPWGTIGLAILAVLAVLGISYGVRRSGLRLKLERR